MAAAKHLIRAAFSKAWKRRAPFFQALENLVHFFPSLGTFRGCFSKAWKKAASKPFLTLVQV
jgi:hypothetical protein